MNNNFQNNQAFCQTCSINPPFVQNEEKKIEEEFCDFCKNKEKISKAQVLFKGKPTCIECKNNPANSIPPLSSSPRANCHNKSNSEYIEHTDNKNNKNPIISLKKIDEISPKISPNTSPSHLRKSKQGYNNKSMDTRSRESLKNQFPSTFKKLSTKEIISLSPSHKKELSNESKLNDFLQKFINEGYSSLERHEKLISLTKIENSSQDFHSICDDKSPLVFLICLNTGFIIGGYHSISLNKNKKIYQDNKACLFSIFGEKIYYYEINNENIAYDEQGIEFGTPPNLAINLNSIDDSTCNLLLKYKSPLGGEVKFKIADNFIWSIMIKEIIICKLV